MMCTTTKRKRNFGSIFLLIPSALLLVAPGQAAGPFSNHKERTSAVAEQQLDPAVTRVIEQKLENDPEVPSYLIEVQTTNQIVTLSGTVPSLLAKDRAISIAQSIRGIKQVQDRLSVEIRPRPANAILADLNKAFRFDPAVESGEIKPEVSEGLVVLNGKVQSIQERNVAEKLARGIPGVRAVENQLQVNFSSDRLDDQIRDDVKSSLKWDVAVAQSRIDVRVQNAKVTLSGTVDSLSEKQRAYSDAWVAGVQAVDATALKVADIRPSGGAKVLPAPSTRDKQIQTAILKAFFKDKRVVSLNPNVHVENGMVTLTGTVRSLPARQAAEEIATDIVGVKGVRNFLKVHPERRYSDDEILRNVRQAIIDDPQVEQEQVRISVVDGVVYLGGAVDTVFERSKAQYCAAMVPGVRLIRNGIDVISENPYQEPVGGTYDLSERPTDAQLEQDIREHLLFNPLVDLADIQVEVQDRVATLEGTVDSLRERNSAEKDAYESGVREVINRLVVDPVNSSTATAPETPAP